MGIEDEATSAERDPYHSVAFRRTALIGHGYIFHGSLAASDVAHFAEAAMEPECLDKLTVAELATTEALVSLSGSLPCIRLA